MSLEGKNIVVAGGSSGIGESVIAALYSAGANIFNISRTTNEHWPRGVDHITFDVLADTFSAAGSLPDIVDGFVYLPGSINLKPFSRLTSDDFLTDYRVNVLGAVKLLQQLLPGLKRSGSASAVLLSSVAASVGMALHSSIAAAKGAINGLTISLAAELAPNKIRVNAVAPSLTETQLATRLVNTPEKKEAAAARHPLGRIGSADDIAAAIVFLLSGQSSWITGQIIGVDGGLSNLRKN
jgi:3-oxoacyl-[acyl-carrier protein] reductase